MTHNSMPPPGYYSLVDYPGLISDAQFAVDRQHVARIAAQQDVLDHETRFAEAAAYDDTLTNDTKRKAYVAEQKQHDVQYGDAMLALAEADAGVRTQDRNEARLRAEFAVSKLVYERGTALVSAGLAGAVYPDAP